MEIPSGARCELFCPVSHKPLDFIGENKATGAKYYALYLTDKLGKGELVAVSDIWGDFESRIQDNFELITLVDDED